MAIEKELKLALGTALIDAAVHFLDAASGGAGRTITLGNVYFDTPALALAQARVALRLRRTPDGWLQTLKTAGKATQGLHARGEWEQPVAGEALELPALLDACDDAAARAAVAAHAAHLRPVFRTDFDRTLWIVEVEGARIEAALDLGAVASDLTDATVPIREIELELKSGDEAALLAFAARLRDAVPGLMPDDVSKAARGYGLFRKAGGHAVSDAALARQFATIPTAWRRPLDAFIGSPTYTRLCAFVDGERAAGKTIYPAEPFRALLLTPPEDVKVVILGQDPYHGEDHGIPQAHGLAFSVPPGVRPPPSLRNICKEISAEFGFGPPPHGCLDHWARQGVLLLNTVLTVERDKAASHAKRGWEPCTDALIAHLGQQRQGIVFMLWGAHAQAKRTLLAQHAHHLVLEAPHPSPLSAHRGFFGCGHFARANEVLTASGRTPIDWRIPAV